MSVTLPKGGNLLLSAAVPGLTRLRIALGWAGRPTGGPAGATGAGVPELDGVISVGRREGDGSERSVQLLLAHQVPNPKENLGAAPAPGPAEAGDVETLVVTLAAIPPEVSRLQIGAVIVPSAGGAREFGSVRGPYVRLLDDADGVELARYDVRPETGDETALVFGELYHHPAGWKFRAVGQGYAQGLAGFTAGPGRVPTPSRPADVAGFLTRTSPAR